MSNNLDLLSMNFAYRKETLANGLDVIVRRQGRLPITAVNLWYHVGSKNEERNRRGFAHLFEHLMFEGSAHYPGDFFQPLQRLGASVNGSTSSDRTNYFVDLPSAHLELALAMESDRMATLAQSLTEEKLRIQKGVVKNEYRQNYENRPYGMCWRLISEALYPPDHPYNWQTIGIMEDLDAATRDECAAFFQRYYVPANASLSIVGDIDEEQALRLAETYFGSIPGGSPASKPWAPRVRRESDVNLRLHDRVELERVYFVWPTVEQFHGDDAALALLADILSGGKSSRLYRELVLDRELAQDLSAFHSSRELDGCFGLVATLRPGRSRDETRALMLRSIDDIAERGVEAEELERFRNRRLAAFIYALDNVGGFGGVADRLNAFNIYLGDPGRIVRDFERFQAVDADHVRNVARRWLAGRPKVTLEVLGRKSTSSVDLDRSARPAPAPPRKFTPPLPEILTLKCGMSLWALPRRDLPIVSATVAFVAGASTHGPDLGGLANLSANMLDEGTVSRDAIAIAEEYEGRGASLSSNCGWDGSYVGLSCLRPDLGAILDLAVDVLRRPTFPESEFRRLHGQTLASLKAQRDSADALAHRVWLSLVCGPSHPYQSPLLGLERTIEPMTSDHCRAFHQAKYRSDQGVWAAAGDFEPEELAKRLDDLLGDQPFGVENGSANGLSGATLTWGPPRLALTHRPGSTQAVLKTGHIGPPRNHPDFVPLLVFNHLFGGQFTSRLNHVLREERGLTYGIRSSFDFRREGGLFAISASLQADRIGEALQVLRDELEAVLDHRPPTVQEIEDAKRSLIEGQPKGFETPSSLVGRYASLYLYGLSRNEYAEFPYKTEAVTFETALAAAQRWIRGENLCTVVVGDSDVIADSLRRLDPKWGEVTILRDEDA